MPDWCLVKMVILNVLGRISAYCNVEWQTIAFIRMQKNAILFSVE